MSGEIDTSDDIVIKKIIKLINRCAWSKLRREGEIAYFVEKIQQKRTRKRKDPLDAEAYWGFLETCIDDMVFDLLATRRENDYLKEQNDYFRELLKELNE